MTQTLPVRALPPVPPGPALQAPPRRRRLVKLPEGWPLFALIALFPLWWLLGISSSIFLILAIPMVWQLSRRRPLVVPPGFGWWLLFLVWVVASVVAINLHAPDTVQGSGSTRLLAYTLRLTNYVAATVVFLYVCNTSERGLPRARLVLLQAIFFCELLVLGLLAIALPGAKFTAPLAAVLPASLSSNQFFIQRTQLSFAQVQDFLGYSSPRPAAPFAYTNAWGEVISLLLVWSVVWALMGGRWRRPVLAVVLVVAAVPMIYSLNRGMWAGVGLAVAYLAFRLARQGRFAPIIALSLLLAAAGLAVLVSPLGTTISDRLHTPHSNEARASVSRAAITGAASSPFLGYGSTRDVEGSAQTITVGRTAACPKCGNAAIGGAGQLWLVLFAQGFVGAFLYIGFFVRTLWAYRKDDSPIAIAGSAVLLMGLLYMLVYGHVGMPLVLYLTAAGLMWRNRLAMTRAALDAR